MTDENFSLEDIRRIRIENHESNKLLSSEEKIQKANQEAEIGLKIIEELRSKRKRAIN